MASLTYVCFVPAKGLIGDLSADSSNNAFELSLAGSYHISIPSCIKCHIIRKFSDETLDRDETCLCNASHKYPVL